MRSAAQSMRRSTCLLLVVSSTIFVTGCSSLHGPPEIALELKCPPLRQYTLQQQQKIADELAAMPVGTEVPPAMRDYRALRDACRAYEKKK